MRKNLYIVLFAFIIFSNKINATHIVGGELNYRHLGGFFYELKLTVYRDCYTGVPPFDNPASIGIFDQNNALIQELLVPFVSLDTLPGIINDPCTQVPTDFCYEVTTYIDTVFLTPIAGGYQLAYQRCCRNENIINLVNPLEAGATYYAHIPDTAVVIDDSNPKFNNWPPPFICANKPLIFDHSAIDYDGDSLVYGLYDPFHGASYIDPMPQPPYNPPYNPVLWQSNFSQNNMLGGIPLSINSSTGLLTATPSILGYFVIGIVVKEYRNGILIGETYRDFQFIVKPCPSFIVAAATVPSIICGEPTVSFNNNSSGAGSYQWNFGDLSTTSDISNVYEPNYTYPTVGTYTATLIAVASNPSLQMCNDTTTTVVEIKEDFTASFEANLIPCSNGKVHLKAIVDNPTPVQETYSWNLGDGNTSTLAEFDHVYGTSGDVTITLICNVPGAVNCKDTVQSKVVYISPSAQTFIPNTFTPNADGVNDIFRVRGPYYNFFYLAVYNRWGERIFESSKMEDGWNGNYKDIKSDPGVYGYYVKASCDGEEFFEKKGNVTLVR